MSPRKAATEELNQGSLLLEFGNSLAKNADGTIVGDGLHRVTYFHAPKEVYPLGVFDEDAWRRGEISIDAVDLDSVDTGEVARQLLQASVGGVTRLPGLEPLLAVIHPGGMWDKHSAQMPTWVHSDTDPAVAEFLASFWGARLGRPEEVEDTHWTIAGRPGVGGGDGHGGARALKTNIGNDIQNGQMFQGGLVLGQTGTATATSATSLTGGTESPGGSHASNDAAGKILVAWTTGVYAVVISNTSGTTPVYTVDRWYTPGSPGGAAATTPSATTGYTLLPASAAAFFIGLTANNGAPASGDTTLTGEITTAGGGLIRKIAPTAHTAGTNTTTLTPVYTANGSDSLPVTVAKIGVSQSILSGNQLFQTLLNATATLSASGDQLTVTETVTM